jgi:hypothetical protein
MNGSPCEAIKARALGEDGGGHLLSDECHQEIIENHPLVMPDERQAGICEKVRLGNAIGPQTVDQAVVRLKEGDLQAGHEGVHVVASIADERDALLVARHIAATGAQQQLGRISTVIEVGRADRAASVQRFQIGARRADVAQGFDIGVRSQRRPVRGDIVR